ncbi:DTW domain-containing protein [Halomonas sp. MCCC 1A17488]|uniref:tRNA-uridine aminocarboxypropyltransferase n=1 Tax=unclassified Halomonas TaxID=2609666 RepID=UPI0018D24A50|nr:MULTISPECIES: tRNA-uridine aminocarboxypropyltransferase [unclassified Halomonas]MCE8017850.1 DTW domain-containing protein [Halomonas sp. MCCC 1A17488]MCG3241183.1 DTW domain-containing protein [Halomonas sp. MCCC 1A17488]QPP49033.1 DTW domain-containing protein [Halomonas sp. SS10-MC5]
MLDETLPQDLSTGHPAAALSADPAPGLAHDPGTGHPRPPRREFKARGSFTERCAGCNLPVLNCLCPYRASAESEARVWLITHPLEHLKPTNTGRLIRDVLPATEVFTWYRTAPDERLLALLDDPRFAPFVIFPDDQPDYAERVVGMEAVGAAKRKDKVPVFILLDGTWRQARRIFRKSDYLDRLPVLPLATSRVTRYRLRKPASQAHLCTAEVAAELLRQSGDGEAAQVLDDYFDAFNVSYAASRRYEKLEAPTAAMRRLLARHGG